MNVNFGIIKELEGTTYSWQEERYEKSLSELLEFDLLFKLRQH